MLSGILESYRNNGIARVIHTFLMNNAGWLIGSIGIMQNLLVIFLLHNDLALHIRVDLAVVGIGAGGRKGVFKSRIFIYIA